MTAVSGQGRPIAWTPARHPASSGTFYTILDPDADPSLVRRRQRARASGRATTKPPPGESPTDRPNRWGIDRADHLALSTAPMAPRSGPRADTTRVQPSHPSRQDLSCRRASVFIVEAASGRPHARPGTPSATVPVADIDAHQARQLVRRDQWPPRGPPRKAPGPLHAYPTLATPPPSIRARHWIRPLVVGHDRRQPFQPPSPQRPPVGICSRSCLGLRRCRPPVRERSGRAACPGSELERGAARPPKQLTEILRSIETGSIDSASGPTEAGGASATHTQAPPAERGDGESTGRRISPPRLPAHDAR